MDDNSQRVVQLLQQLGAQQQQQQQQQATSSPAAEKGQNILTTYPKALRHVVDNVLTNPQIVETLRLLRQNQSVHEEQWLKARQAIQHRHEQRHHLQGELDKILSMVGSGGGASGGGGGGGGGQQQQQQQGDIQQELLQYDAKVYKACCDMVNHMKRDLASCGIPFFHPDYQSMYNPQTLVQLQRRILTFLDDYLAADDVVGP